MVRASSLTGTVRVYHCAYISAGTLQNYKTYANWESIALLMLLQDAYSLLDRPHFCVAINKLLGQTHVVSACCLTRSPCSSRKRSRGALYNHLVEGCLKRNIVVSIFIVYNFRSYNFNDLRWEFIFPIFNLSYKLSVHS